MRKALVGFIVGVVFASSSLAVAARHGRLLFLRSGDETRFQGVSCFTNGKLHTVACALTNRYWYTVGLSLHRVVVLNKAGVRVLDKRR